MKFIQSLKHKNIPADFFKQGRSFFWRFHGYVLDSSLEHKKVLGFYIDANLLQLVQVSAARNALKRIYD